ncbi:MAG: DUF2281 domain-containing protein [Nitrospirae bacterium]|nr:DUF2281 domain-containing protein [Nitrospirota bacterium]
MQVKELLLKEIERVPEESLVELLDFTLFLEAKALQKGVGTAITSETSLMKDWLRPEEDEAWQDL